MTHFFNKALLGAVTYISPVNISPRLNSRLNKRNKHSILTTEQERHVEGSHCVRVSNVKVY